MRGSREVVDSGHWISTAGCVIVLLLCVVVAHPVVNGAYSDDFSYIYTAKRAAETGRLIYNGWACPMLGIQVYLAAGLIRIFGFTFTVARAAVVLFAAANVAMLHRLFLRLSPRNSNAVVAALSLAAAPIAFSHSVIFFTDVPGQFAFTVALFCCVRAMQAESSADTRRWLVWCVVLNLLLGTVRQTAWFGSLLLLPAVGWRLRHRPGVLKSTAILWVTSVCFVYACVTWLSHAPYAPQESLRTHLTSGWLMSVPLLPLLTLLELLPLLLSVTGIREARRNRRFVLFALVVAALVAAGAATIGKPMAPVIIGTLLGRTPPNALALSIGIIAILVFLATLAVQEAWSNAVDTSVEASGVNVQSLLAVLWPYLLVVSGLVMTREGVWPRYVLPLLPALAAMLYSLHAERTHRARLPVITTGAAILATVLAVARTHDDMLAEEAVVKMQERYVAMGLPRNQLETGMSEDGWYEVSTGHHINEPRIRNPAGAYHRRILSPQQTACHSYFIPLAPDIHSSYVIARGASPCVDPQPLASNTQSYWMRSAETFYIFRFVPSQRLP